MKTIVKHYKNLASVLKQHRAALEEGDEEALHSSLAEIHYLTALVTKSSKQFDTLSHEDRSSVIALIKEIQKEIPLTEKLWLRTVDQVRKENAQLQASRRYHSALQNQQLRPQRYSRSG